MNYWNRIMHKIRKGGIELKEILIGQTIQRITDHPKIGVEGSEMRRIESNFKYYKGMFPDIEYMNSLGKKVKRPYFTLNMSEIVARYIAGLVFNEQCKIYIDNQNESMKEYNENEANKFIQKVFTDNNFKDVFSEKLEAMFATGGLAVRPYVDNGRIEFSWCLADTFLPLESNTNSISEACITNVTTVSTGKKTNYYTLLEFHEWKDNDYIIRHELYWSQRKDEVGKRIKLTDLDVYADLPEEITIKNLTRPLFTHLKPHGFNNINPRSPLGLSVVDNAKPTLNVINETFDAFHWEIKQGKRKVIVSDHFLRTKFDNDGNPIQYFDEETDVFVGLPAGIDDMSKQDITSDIRAGQYIESINKFIATLEMQTGISSGTFTFDGKSIKTATEIVSEKSETYRTRNLHLNKVEGFLKGLIISVFEIAKVYNLYSGDIPSEEEIGIDFDDGVFTDKNAQLDFLSKAKQSEMIPAKEASKRLFNLTDEQAKAWIDEINKERFESSQDYYDRLSDKQQFGDEE